MDVTKVHTKRNTLQQDRSAILDCEINTSINIAKNNCCSHAVANMCVRDLLSVRMHAGPETRSIHSSESVSIVLVTVDWDRLLIMFWKASATLPRKQNLKHTM